MKIIHCISGSEKHIQTQQTLKKLQQIKHQNLVQIYEFFDEEGSFYIFMEKCDQDVDEMIQKLKINLENQESLTKFIENFIIQIVNGYCRLMEDNIIHRDLKPQNILYNIVDENQYVFKICDDGFSKIIDLNQDYGMTSVEHLNYYQAPELKEDEYTYKLDIYSFGLILAEMIIGRKFTEVEKLQLQDSVIQLTNNSPKDIIYLINQMLALEQKARLSWTQLKLKYFYPQYNSQNENLQKIQDINGKNICIKPICKRQHNAYQNELNEIKINLKIKNNQKQNDNIIKIIEVLNEKDYDYSYIIMEECEGDLNQLRAKIGLFNYQDVLNLLEQINNGYQFLIENQIVHRDLKPQNILYQRNNSKYCYKIIDFQYSFELKNQNFSASSKTGTRMYQAPEIDGIQEYDYKCDIYSEQSYQNWQQIQNFLNNQWKKSKKKNVVYFKQ
ncbi:unnamed protein product [Paramecium sonneborni]|uniref:Protein kinase domain-containing protein n=1 Tax=Paramecium sonneborni TaxID=65129 RepID=A0A8S1NSW0_9CILI|nr:unnamed protein product [Paramecium sonneborni]